LDKDVLEHSLPVLRDSMINNIIAGNNNTSQTKQYKEFLNEHKDLNVRTYANLTNMQKIASIKVIEDKFELMSKKLFGYSELVKKPTSGASTRAMEVVQREPEIYTLDEFRDFSADENKSELKNIENTKDKLEAQHSI
jgi:predicted ATP-grasp superfamily ATP-dependent carboligase